MNENTALTSSPSTKKWVLITGGAQRLGRTISLAFARQGWGVVCHYRQSDAQAQTLRNEIEAAGGTCRLVQADLADTEAVARLLPRAAEAAGGAVTCLVNNASEFEPDTGADFKTDDLLRAFTVNTLTPLALTQALFHQHCQGASATPGCAIHVLDQKVHNLNPD